MPPENLTRDFQAAFLFPMQKPVYPTIPTAYVFQEFANINWQMYARTEGKHMGCDIGIVSGQPGAPIYAAYYGLVVEAGYSDQGGYGRRVVIEHETRRYSTLYAHLKDVTVQVGDVVEAGKQIGTMGGNVEDKQRGASGGTHLHFEVILRDPVPGSIRTSRGYCVDPIPYLMQRYFPAPINAIKVTSVKGLRVRSKPQVTSESIRYLFMKDVVNIAEVLPASGGAQWVKLWSLRDEYSALKYDGQINAEFVAPLVVDVTPPPAPEPGESPSGGTYAQGYNAAIQKIESYLETLKGEVTQ
jgi:murein DD-endopeptidase MepM/ murein hydrolase activator NlpD